VGAVHVDTGEFRALAADVAAIKDTLEKVRFEQVYGDMQQVMARAYAEAEVAARTGRRRTRPDGARPSQLRAVPGERRSS
jgi:hypothetical protein